MEERGADVPITFLTYNRAEEEEEELEEEEEEEEEEGLMSP